MSSVCRSVVAIRIAIICVGLLTSTTAWLIAAGQTNPLRVCADPNNLPFSNAQGEGFENDIARLVARELHRSLRYFWEPQRRGFIRTTLNARNCDVVIGVPAHYELVQSTRPYYRSTYVFVTRADRGLQLESLDDARLRRMVIGIQITGEDYDNPPPAQALASRGLAPNVRGFPIYGDYSQPAPQRTVMDAVADGHIDTAVVWGPLAGYFATRVSVPLIISAVSPSTDRFSLPFTFEIAMGVRHGDAQLRDALNGVITGRAREIRTVLRRYGVPLVDAAPTRTHSPGRSKQATNPNPESRITNPGSS